jgi:hypothetical protein
MRKRSPRKPKESAAPGQRDGVFKTDSEALTPHTAILAPPARRTRLSPVWSEDRKHLQGWESDNE